MRFNHADRSRCSKCSSADSGQQRLGLLQIQKDRRREDLGARLIEALVLQAPSDFADMRLYTRAPRKHGAIVRVRGRAVRQPKSIVISDCAVQLEIREYSFAVHVKVRRRSRQKAHCITCERLRIRLPNSSAGPNTPALPAEYSADWLQRLVVSLVQLVYQIAMAPYRLRSAPTAIVVGPNSILRHSATMHYTRCLAGPQAQVSAC